METPPPPLQMSGAVTKPPHSENRYWKAAQPHRIPKANLSPCDFKDIHGNQKPSSATVGTKSGVKDLCKTHVSTAAISPTMAYHWNLMKTHPAPPIDRLNSKRFHTLGRCPEHTFLAAPPGCGLRFPLTVLDFRHISCPSDCRSRKKSPHRVVLFCWFVLVCCLVVGVLLLIRCWCFVDWLLTTSCLLLLGLWFFVNVFVDVC